MNSTDIVILVIQDPLQVVKITTQFTWELEFYQLVFSLTQPAKITDTSIYHEIPKVFTGNRQLLADNAILKQVLKEIEKKSVKERNLF